MMAGPTFRDDLLPRPPAPPDDPTMLRLDGRVGWRVGHLDGVEAAPDLALAPVPGTGRSLGEASGSLGGTILPATVALGPDGSVYLLDTTTSRLKRFDPCECRFDAVPCLGGFGNGARQVRDPRAIAICAGNLFVCDAGNRRIGVFALHDFVLRGFWVQPPAAGLAHPWQPVAIAFDGRGRAYVADPANGCLHRFSPAGRWETCLPGLGAVDLVAVDCHDRLHVRVSRTPPLVRVLDENGAPIGEVSRPDELAGRFPPLPFRVDAAGNLHLRETCLDLGAPPPGQIDVFDPSGKPARIPVPDEAVRYLPVGDYLSEALDSRLYRCQWHRVILGGELPPGTSVEVLTYAAEAEHALDFVRSLPDDDWDTGQTIWSLPDGTSDCLVRSGGGRYLWLRLRLRGNGVATPSLTSVTIEFPRIGLHRFLPAVFGADPLGADFTDRFLAIFDTTLRGIEATIDDQARLFDPRSAPATRRSGDAVDFLTWLGSWIGATADPRLPVARRRELIRHAARLFHLRGTRDGLWRQLLLYLGIEPEALCCPNDHPRTRCVPLPPNCVPDEPSPCAWEPPPLIVEHYRLRRWLFLGDGRLGDQAILWGKRIVNRSQLDDGAQVGGTKLVVTQDPRRDPFHVYAHTFSVFVPTCFRRPEQRKGLELLLRASRPAHTVSHLVFVEPRFRIGFQSMIGLDSVVGRYPAGVTLDGMALGRETVLAKPQSAGGGPTPAIGTDSRVGTTTKLD